MQEKKILNFNEFYLFGYISILYILLIYLTNTYILTDHYYQVNFAGKVDLSRIAEVITVKRKYEWIAYIFQPIINFVKVGIIAGVIYIGAFLFEQKLPYRTSLKIVILAELIPLSAVFTKVLYFVIHKAKSGDEFPYFFPLSITQVLNPKSIPTYYVYALQKVNVFELAYWTLLVFCLTALLKNKWIISFKIIFSTYGLALITWILFITFITLDLS